MVNVLGRDMCRPYRLKYLAHIEWNVPTVNVALRSTSIYRLIPWGVLSALTQNEVVCLLLPQ
jgi:hypothetical protein